MITQTPRSTRSPCEASNWLATRKRYTSSLTTMLAIMRLTQPFGCARLWVSSFRCLRRRRNCFELGYRVEEPRSRAGPPLPSPLVRLKAWLGAHHVTLMTIADTPHSIALGSAIGIFFGFTPLWSIKTLLSIAVAWICRCNKIAAAIAVTLHDVLIFVMPAIYFAEYKMGCWILRRPVPLHHLRFHFGLHDYLNTGLFV